MNNWISLLREDRESFYTPLRIAKDCDMYQTLKGKLKLLASSMEKVGADKELVRIASQYEELLTNVVDSYYGGYASEAQQIIDELLFEFEDSDRIAFSFVNNSISFGGFPNEVDEVQLFRARCSEGISDYTQEEMLHIPFSKRSIVKTARFSIPGLPCLYLGTTSYVCWIELNRPADHQFNVSAVTLDNTQKLFNLAINFNDFLNYCEEIYDDPLFENKEKTVASIFRLFILSFACSFVVLEDNRSFKSEYIIPQLIMMSCMKRGLAGVTYYSKRVENDIMAYSVGVNVALFARYNGEKEYSSICHNIKISASFNYSMYTHLTAPQTYKQAKLRIDNVDRIQNIGTFSRKYPYRETTFYFFDRYLFAYMKPKSIEFALD